MWMKASILLPAVSLAFALRTAASPTLIQNIVRQSGNFTLGETPISDFPAQCQTPCNTGIGATCLASGASDPASCCDAGTASAIASCSNCVVAAGSIDSAAGQAFYNDYMQGCGVLGVTVQSATIDGGFSKKNSAGKFASTTAAMAATGLVLGVIL